MFGLFSISIANAAVDTTAFGNLLNPIINVIVYPVIQLLFGAAVVVFVYGVLQFVIHSDDADARKKGKLTSTWGAVGIFIMVSAWGIIYLVSNTVKDLAQ